MSGIEQLTSNNQFPPPADVQGPNPWKIVEVQMPVAALGGHNFFVLIDPTGKVVSELDGGALIPTSRIKGSESFFENK